MVEARVEYDFDPQNDDELTLRVGDIITNIVQKEGGWWEGKLKEKHGLFPDNFVKVLTKDQNKNSEQSKADSNGVQLRKDKKRKCRVVYSYTPVNDDELELQVDTLIDVLEEVEEGWWKGVLNGRVGVFPSNFVEDAETIGSSHIESRSSKENVSDGPDKGRDSGGSSSNQIKPKPVRGVGLGNIFQDEMIKLKPAQDTPSEKKAVSTIPKKPPPPASSIDAPLLPPKPVREQARVLFPYDACNEDELSLKEGDIINILSKEIEDKGWWKGELNNRVGVFPDNFVELVTVPDVQVRKPERPSINNKISATQNLLHAVNRCQSASETADSPPPVPDHPKRPLPDVVKKDDKPERPDKPMPPLPSKKPQLPPPMKKPQRPAAPAPPVSPGAPVPASVPAPAPSSVAAIPSIEALTDDMKVKSQDDSSFDSVEPTSDKLTHLTATRVRNPHRRPPSHVFLKETPPALQDKLNGDIAGKIPRVGLAHSKPPSTHLLPQTKASKDILLESEDIHSKVADRSSAPSSEPERPPPSCPVRKDSAPAELERPANIHPVRKDAPERPLARPSSFKAISLSSAEADVAPLPARPKPHGLPPKPATLSRDEGDNRIARNTTSSEESLPIVIDLRREVQQLKSTVSSLQQTMESHKVQYTEKIKELTQEIDEEKKTRVLMQLELDRLKKLVKEP